MRKMLGYGLMVLGVCALGVTSAQAQTDMSSAITTVSGYWTTIYPIGVAIVVFIVGRKIVKKL